MAREKQNAPRAEGRVIAAAGGRAAIVRGLTWVIGLGAVAAIAALAWGARARPEEALVAYGAMPVTAAFALGMGLYARLYVAELRETADALWITTATPFARPRRLEKTAIARVGANDGDMPLGHGGSAAATPFLTLWLKGAWLPYVIDEQGAVCDAAALYRLEAASSPRR